MDPLFIILALPIGILVGLGAGVIGLTAWPLLVPLLFVFGGFPLHDALLSSILIDLVTAITLSIFYVRRPEVGVEGVQGFKLGGVAGFMAITAAIIAFPLLEQFSDMFRGGSAIITLLFGAVFIIQAVRMKDSLRSEISTSEKTSSISREERRSDRISDKQKAIISYGFCAFQGFLTGMIAMGGAMMIALVLMFLVGYSTLRAVGTAMIISTIMLLVTAVVYLLFLGFALSTMSIVVLYATIAVISCLIAVTRVQNIPERKLRFIIGIVVLVAAIFATFQVYVLE
ncbi:MAG: TSUP family transporter [Candidatus Hodarchaeota archaeon]